MTLALSNPWYQAARGFGAVDDLGELEAAWDRWVPAMFPDYCVFDFAPHHRALWSWLWEIEPAVRPHPHVDIWGRGGAKSSSAEMACVGLGARRKRRYGLYISETQDQADEHVETIGSMLESATIETYYPAMASRAVSKYGSSRGWRRNRLRTASGFTIDALGLDRKARGVKFEDARPDFMVLDDLDSEGDSMDATQKKIQTLTRKILPAGARDLAVLAIQNLIIPEGIFARLAGLAEEKADFLADRIVSGPVPALEGLVYVQRAERWVITEGHPTWAGQDVEQCQKFIDTFGISAFLSEAQHEVEARPGGMFDHLTFARCAPERVPQLVRSVVWVDPAVTDKDTSDAQAIQADGLGVDGRVYRLRSYEARSSPRAALGKAIRWAIEIGATTVGVETDQGGDTWESVWREAMEDVMTERDTLFPGSGRHGIVKPIFTSDKAGAGYGPKAHRAGQMLADYERPGTRIVHVEGTHLILERALKRFPRTKPLDLVDASFWSWHDLREGQGRGQSSYTDRRDAGRR